MTNETVAQRSHLGGALTTAARPEAAFADAQTPSEIENLSVAHDKAQALEGVSLHVHEGARRRGRG
jgi:branched-chain amino acid transport system ATP-binding protein